MTLSAAEIAGEATDRVQAKVLESGRPWTPETAVFLMAGTLRDEDWIDVGSPVEIAERIRPIVLATMNDRYTTATRKRGAQQALSLVEKPAPMKGKSDCVRWVTRGKLRDWYSGWLVQPSGGQR